eukprot:Gb_10450 [translate_table: standard]
MITLLSAGQILKSTKAAVHRPHPHESVFQTGCGNSVDVSIGGLSKTKAVLHAEGLEVPAESRVSKGTASLFSDLRSGQSKYFPNKDLVITADGSNVHSLGSSDTKSNRMHQFMFQTAEGQSVNVSTTAMKRAMNLLGNEIKRGATAVESVNSSGSFHSLSDLKTETIDSVEPPPLLFQTAGGRSVSISNAAMKRAMNLLGEAGGLSTTGMDVQRMSGDFMDSSANHSLRTVRHCNGIVSNKENLPYPAHISQVVSVGINTPPVKLCHVESMNFSTDSILSSKVVGFGIREAPMPLKFVHNGSCMDNDLSHRQEPVNSCFSGITKKPEASMVKETGARKLGKRKGCISPLAEISNKTPAYDLGNHCQGLGANSTVHGSILGSKRRSALSRYASPFKQPRRSRFLSPYDTSLTCAAVQPGLPVQSFPQEVTCEVKLQSLYPSNRKRKTMQEYFGGPPHHQQALWYLPNEIQSMTADAAQHYKFIAKSKSGDETYQSQDFGKLLLQSGADPRYTTTEKYVMGHIGLNTLQFRSTFRNPLGRTTCNYISKNHRVSEAGAIKQIWMSCKHLAITHAAMREFARVCLVEAALRRNPASPLALPGLMMLVVDGELLVEFKGMVGAGGATRIWKIAWNVLCFVVVGRSLKSHGGCAMAWEPRPFGHYSFSPDGGYEALEGWLND